MPRTRASWQRWTVIVALAVAAPLVAFQIYYPFSSAARQKKNLAEAERVLPEVLGALAGEVRFRKVMVGVHTIDDGCLMAWGAVRTEEDLAALKARIAATQPPVNVNYRVEVLSEREFDEFGI